MFWDTMDFCKKLLKAEWKVNQQEGEEEFKCYTIWQMMVALLHSNGQLRTERYADTEKGCQKPAVQQKTTGTWWASIEIPPTITTIILCYPSTLLIIFCHLLLRSKLVLPSRDCLWLRVKIVSALNALRSKMKSSRNSHYYQHRAYYRVTYHILQTVLLFLAIK